MLRAILKEPICTELFTMETLINVMKNMGYRL